MNPQQLDDKLLIERAISQLLLSSQPSAAFLATAAMHVDWIPDYKTKTLKTDGTRTWYNPDYFRNLPSEGQRIFAVSHEIWHAVLLHPYRRNGRDPLEWNISADHRVNLDLIKWGIGEPIPGIYADAQFGDLSAEQIYAKRQNDAPPPPPPQPKAEPEPDEDEPEDDDETDSEDDSDDDEATNPGDESWDPAKPDADDSTDGPGDDQDAPGDGDSPMPDCPTGDFVDADESAQGVDAQGDPAPPPMTPEDWAIVSQIAAAVAQGAGDIGDGMARALAKAREPEHDWVQELRQYVIQLLPSGQSWARPNRRFIGDGVYLPGSTHDTVGPVVFLIDTSCSVTQRMLDGFAAHVTKVMQEVQPERIHVAYIDTEVRGTAVFERDEEIKLELKGGGGTLFGPALRWIEENEIEPMVAVYLTDLENYDNPLTEPPYPVLWATPNWITRMPPFGDVVRVDVER